MIELRFHYYPCNSNSKKVKIYNILYNWIKSCTRIILPLQKDICCKWSPIILKLTYLF